MAAIAATSLTDRNAIIDWLRQQGFLFARASWLERIYHNGGRPIYLDAANLGFVAPRATSQNPLSSLPPVPARAEPAAISPRPPASKPAPVDPPASALSPAPPQLTTRSETTSLDALLTEAKAYRPLAHFVLRELETSAPRLAFEARNGFVAIMGPRGLAGVLTISPKGLRLGLAWLDGSPPAPFTKVKVTKTHPDVPAEISHMVMLTDARQVTADLLAAVAQAAD